MKRVLGSFPGLRQSSCGTSGRRSCCCRRRLSELQDAATTTERVRAALLENLPSGDSSMANV
jgi:hypothetical protein